MTSPIPPQEQRLLLAAAPTFRWVGRRRLPLWRFLVGAARRTRPFGMGAEEHAAWIYEQLGAWPPEEGA